MTEVISPDKKELLTYVLGDIHNTLYIHVVRDLKQKTEQKLESGELEAAEFPLRGHHVCTFRSNRSKCIRLYQWPIIRPKHEAGYATHRYGKQHH